MRSMSAPLVASPVSGSAVRPMPRISSATFPTVAGLRLVTATSAPASAKARAMPLPIPRPAPAISTLCPLMSNWGRLIDQLPPIIPDSWRHICFAVPLSRRPPRPAATHGASTAVRRPLAADLSVQPQDLMHVHHPDGQAGQFAASFKIDALQQLAQRAGITPALSLQAEHALQHPNAVCIQGQRVIAPAVCQHALRDLLPHAPDLQQRFPIPRNAIPYRIGHGNHERHLAGTKHSPRVRHYAVHTP